MLSSGKSWWQHMRRELFAPEPHETVRSVINDTERQMRDIGVIAGAYFLTPAFHSQISRRTVIAMFGVPDEVAEMLEEEDVRNDDPFPDFIMAAARPMTWREVILTMKMTEQQRAYVERLDDLGLIDAVSIPLFSPNGRDSYSVFDLGRLIEKTDKPLVTQIAALAQLMHMKVCMIIDRDHRGSISISKRESEVLRWMAHGKSNADIAAILGVAPGTVDTFVRRIYAKLKVNDRISAVLAGISRGLVNL